MGGAGISPPAARVGRYALHREIGAGGMATIHLGKLCGPAGFAPVVAIKSLHAHYAKSPEFVRMFLDEARLAGRIRHPNVVSVLDVFAAEGELFLVLEYVHGESLGRLLADAVREGMAVRPAIASAIICDALHGLHAAHEAKGERGEPLDIVHRDVSPQNIIVGVDGCARVLDFGVAKAAGRLQTTQDGQVKGKFAYMAPEQLRGERVNRQADVYSAAVVLWEVLAGKRLFGADNEGTIVQQALFGDVEAPSSFRRDIPRALDAVVMRGLARERSERFSSAREMALALEAAIPSAPPPEVGEWVEARAVDALETRARLVAEVEAASVQEPPAETDIERLVAGMRDHPGKAAGRPAEKPKVPGAPQEESTAGQTVPDATPKRGLLERGRITFVGAAAVLCVAAATFLFFRPPPASVPATASVEATATAPPSSVDSPLAALPEPQAPPPATEASAPAVVADAAARTTKPRTPAQPRSFAAPRSAGPAPGAPCARHDAEGVITFDKDCLRAAQRRP